MLGSLHDSQFLHVIMHLSRGRISVTESHQQKITIQNFCLCDGCVVHFLPYELKDVLTPQKLSSAIFDIGFFVADEEYGKMFWQQILLMTKISQYMIACVMHYQLLTRRKTFTV